MAGSKVTGSPKAEEQAECRGKAKQGATVSNRVARGKLREGVDVDGSEDDSTDGIRKARMSAWRAPGRARGAA